WRVNDARGVVGVGEQEGFYARFESLFELIQVQAGAFGMVQVIEFNRHDLTAQELDQLTIGEVGGPHDRDLVAGGDGGGNRQKQRALRARGNDQFVVARDRAAGERGQPGGNLFTQGGGAPVFGIGLFAAAFDTLHKLFQRAGRRR